MKTKEYNQMENVLFIENVRINIVTSDPIYLKPLLSVINRQTNIKDTDKLLSLLVESVKYN